MSHKPRHPHYDRLNKPASSHMVSYRLIPFLAIIYQIKNVFSTLQSGELKIQVNDGEDSMSSCQTCILDSLGATRMKRKSYTTNAFESVATYEIIGSNFVFANLRLDCGSEAKCIIDKLAMSSSKQWRTMVSEEPVISLDKLSRYILTSRLSAGVLCMACLQENVAARSIGKFRLTTKRLIDHIFYVFEDSKTTPYADACKDYCPDLVVQEQTDGILELVRQLPFKKIQTSSPSNVLDTSDATSPSHSTIQCLKPQKLLTTSTTIEACRRCVAWCYNTDVISTQIDLKLILYIFAARWEDRKELVKCQEECGLIKVLKVTHANCRIPMNNQFLMFPDGEQLLASLSIASNHELSSGCVWAKNMDYDSCLNCLHNIKASTEQKLSESTSFISLHPFEHGLFDNREYHLKKCVSNDRCRQLVVVPNAMCLYESTYLRRGTAPLPYALLEDHRNPTMPKIRISQSQPIQPDSFFSLSHGSSSFSSKYMDAQAHDGLALARQSDNVLLDNKNLLNVGFSSVSPAYLDARTQSSEHQRNQQILVNKANKRWVTLDPNHLLLRKNVLVVHWSLKGLKCVLCLALYGEVLLFSVERSYAWMIEDPYPVITCDVCGHVTKENAMSLDVFSMRPIPRSGIESIYNEHENDCCSTTETSSKKRKRHKSQSEASKTLAFK